MNSPIYGKCPNCDHLQPIADEHIDVSMEYQETGDGEGDRVIQVLHFEWICPCLQLVEVQIPLV